MLNNIQRQQSCYLSLKLLKNIVSIFSFLFNCLMSVKNQVIIITKKQNLKKRKHKRNGYQNKSIIQYALIFVQFNFKIRNEQKIYFYDRNQKNAPSICRQAGQ
ncbi:hypothetical protein ABPG72_014264 [Tetrahymena utriculariae]